ncbi:hypothetical protein V8C42DRAFT_49340 [Trichoderma barbatum]
MSILHATFRIALTVSYVFLFIISRIRIRIHIKYTHIEYDKIMVIGTISLVDSVVMPMNSNLYYRNTFFGAERRYGNTCFAPESDWSLLLAAIMDTGDHL